MPTSYKLPLSSNPECVAIPSDPDIPFTPEQEAAFFAGDVHFVLRNIVLNASRDADFMRRLAQPTPAHTPPTQRIPGGASALEKVRANVT